MDDGHFPHSSPDPLNGHVFMIIASSGEQRKNAKLKKAVKVRAAIWRSRGGAFMNLCGERNKELALLTLSSHTRQFLAAVAQFSKFPAIPAPHQFPTKLLNRGISRHCPQPEKWGSFVPGSGNCWPHSSLIMMMMGGWAGCGR